MPSHMLSLWNPFIVALVVAQHILSISQPLSLALQATNCDIVKAYQDAALCTDTILSQHQDKQVYCSVEESYSAS